MRNENAIVGLVLAAVVGTLGWSALRSQENPHTSTLKYFDTWQNEARQVARDRVGYKPVGNGGALAEWSGRITEDRQQMYDAINEEYLNILTGVSPSE